MKVFFHLLLFRQKQQNHVGPRTRPNQACLKDFGVSADIVPLLSAGRRWRAIASGPVVFFRLYRFMLLSRIIHKSGFKVFNFGQNCDFRFDFKLGFSAHETVLYLFLHFQVFDTSGVLFKA